MTMLPFDNQRDEELGRLLREQLSGPQPEAFLRRMRVAVAGADRHNQWEVLDGWARPRVMAMAVAAALLLWTFAWFSSRDLRPDAGVTLSSLPSHSVVNQESPRTDEIMGALLAGR